MSISEMPASKEKTNYTFLFCFVKVFLQLFLQEEERLILMLSFLP